MRQGYHLQRPSAVVPRTTASRPRSLGRARDRRSDPAVPLVLRRIAVPKAPSLRHLSPESPRVKRIVRPRFRGPYPYRRSGSSRRLPLRSTRRFRRRGAGLGTPALTFDRCTAPVKLPARRCPRIGRHSSGHAGAGCSILQVRPRQPPRP